MLIAKVNVTNVPSGLTATHIVRPPKNVICIVPIATDGTIVPDMLWHEREALAKQRLTDEEEFRLNASYRASGEVICDACGKKYYDHEDYIPSGKTNDGVPWLVELCNGDLVHL